MWPCPLTPGQRQQRGHGAALCTLGSSSMSWKVGPRLKGITGRDFGGFISHPLLPRGCPTKTMACEAGFPPGPGGDVTCPGWGCHLPWVGMSPALGGGVTSPGWGCHLPGTGTRGVSSAPFWCGIKPQMFLGVCSTGSPSSPLVLCLTSPGTSTTSK